MLSKVWKKIHPVKWFHDWEDRILIENWIPIRYQPILFFFLFAGIIFVLFFRPSLPAMTQAVGSFSAYMWLVLALVCPPILFISWLMIHWGTGKKTAFGYYARFAADIGQTFSFIAFLVAGMTDPTPETEDGYSLIIMTSILVFLIVIVIRDVLKLILLERTSTIVHDIKVVEGVKDIFEIEEVKSALDERGAHLEGHSINDHKDDNNA